MREMVKGGGNGGEGSVDGERVQQQVRKNVQPKMRETFYFRCFRCGTVEENAITMMMMVMMMSVAKKVN